LRVNKRFQAVELEKLIAAGKLGNPCRLGGIGPDAASCEL
jgi:hypothetical protein